MNLDIPYKYLSAKEGFFHISRHFNRFHEYIIDFMSTSNSLLCRGGPFYKHSFYDLAESLSGEDASYKILNLGLSAVPLMNGLCGI